MQRRVGPPLLQPLYDIVKLHGKETQISHGLIHEIGIVMAVGGYVAAETLLPVPGMNGIADKGGLITLLYLIMIPSLGLALGVGQCANPNGSIGISRALTAMLAYDMPLVIVIFGVACHFGTINLVDIIATQQAGGTGDLGRGADAAAGHRRALRAAGHARQAALRDLRRPGGDRHRAHGGDGRQVPGRAVRHAVLPALHRRACSTPPCSWAAARTG